VNLAHPRGELSVVLAQFSQHIEGGDVVGVIVEHMLKTTDVADRPQGRSADFAHPLAIASVAAKICVACSSNISGSLGNAGRRRANGNLRFDIQRKHISKQS